MYLCSKEKEKGSINDLFLMFLLVPTKRIGVEPLRKQSMCLPVF